MITREERIFCKREVEIFNIKNKTSFRILFNPLSDECCIVNQDKTLNFSIMLIRHSDKDLNSILNILLDNL